MILSAWPLQKAVFAALTGNASLMARVTGVFDWVPEGTAFPYVTIGETASADWSTKTSTGQSHALTLHVWSQAPGRQEAKEIIGLVAAVLDDAALALDGAALVLLRFVSSDTMADPDGRTTHGIVRFRALTQAE